MIYFSDFGSGVSPFVIAVQDFDTGTTTGTPISYTATPLAGQTPKAMLVVGSYHEIAAGSSERTAAILGFGAIAGANQRGISIASQDNVAASDSRRVDSDSFAFTLQRLSGVVQYAQFGSGTALADGGITVTWNTTNADRRPNFMAFAGSDVTAACGDIDLGSSTSAVTVTVGFAADVVILFEIDDTSFAAGILNNIASSFGIATADGTQRCILMSELDNDAAGGNPKQALLTDSCGGVIDPTTGALTYKVVAGNFTGTSFDLTPSASTGGKNIAYLALKLNGHAVKLVTFDTPTSTGNHDITGAGFTPQAALAFVTNLSATDPTFPVSTGDDQGGLAICSIGDEQWSHAIRINSGSDPTDAASFSGNYAMIQPSATDCKAGLATLNSWISGGVRLNWSAAQGSAKKGLILFIQ